MDPIQAVTVPVVLALGVLAWGVLWVQHRPTTPAEIAVPAPFTRQLSTPDGDTWLPSRSPAFDTSTGVPGTF